MENTATPQTIASATSIEQLQAEALAMIAEWKADGFLWGIRWWGDTRVSPEKTKPVSHCCEQFKIGSPALVEAVVLWLTANKERTDAD